MHGRTSRAAGCRRLESVAASVCQQLAAAEQGSTQLRTALDLHPVGWMYTEHHAHKTPYQKQKATALSVTI